MKLMGDNIRGYKTKLIKPFNGNDGFKMCKNGFCCHFSIEMEYREHSITESAKYYQYRLAVFNGVRYLRSGDMVGIEVCGIIACRNNTTKSCNKRYNIVTDIVNPITFRFINIRTQVSISSNISRFPLSLTSNMDQLNVNDFIFSIFLYNATHNTIEYTLKKPSDDLMTFALYGRNFTRDRLPKTLPKKKKQKRY
ncbi:hypothetical protein PV327_000775 [Microctonus hyperodae]|uniref:Vanin C-terminal domain-containing protein n=1 Tax=Microctonus hyperodae TaxID=165561 RepID=A0AA39G6Y3_MICHY|nr:hypothetical protein PV327_000775 [Microctonus hyperodae]